MSEVFKCDACGRFIAFADILSGKAFHDVVTPLSDVSYEKTETLCVECYGKETGDE